MLSTTEIEKSLFQSADIFRDLMSKKEYIRAKICYENTRTVAVAVRLDADKMTQLFGSRQTDPPIEGLFPEYLVQKAYRECMIRHRESEAIEDQLRQMRRGSGKAGLEALRKEWQ